MCRARQLLDYAVSNKTAIVTFKASDMILRVHSDASYNSAPQARSRVGGHFFLTEDEDDPRGNGAVHTVAQIIKRVMTSAAEAELGALYLNARETIYIRRVLEELGHPQPKTPIQTDNATAEQIVTGKVLPRRLKLMDRDLYWLRDQEAQQNLRFYWRPGPTNRGDYHTKNHPATHHAAVRNYYLTPEERLVDLRRRLANTKQN